MDHPQIRELSRLFRNFTMGSSVVTAQNISNYFTLYFCVIACSCYSLYFCSRNIFKILSPFRVIRLTSDHHKLHDMLFSFSTIFWTHFFYQHLLCLSSRCTCACVGKDSDRLLHIVFKSSLDCHKKKQRLLYWKVATIFKNRKSVTTHHYQCLRIPVKNNRHL